MLVIYNSYWDTELGMIKYWQPKVQLCYIILILDFGIECDLHQQEGYGIIIIEHDLEAILEMSTKSSKDFLVSYSGFEIDYELLAVIGMSRKCEQEITFHCPGMHNTTYWTSVTGDKWYFSQLVNCSR